MEYRKESKYNYGIFKFKGGETFEGDWINMRGKGEGFLDKVYMKATEYIIIHQVK